MWVLMCHASEKALQIDLQMPDVVGTKIILLHGDQIVDRIDEYYSALEITLTAVRVQDD